jgi:hypothetical protein
MLVDIENINKGVEWAKNYNTFIGGKNLFCIFELCDRL